MCFIYMAHRLLDPKHFLLPFLGSRFPLEVAVGTNGRVWISSKEIKQTIAIARCIEVVDPDGGGLDESGVKTFVNTLDL
jgi:exosome complex component RRP40